MHNQTETLVQRVFSIPSYADFTDTTKENVKNALLDYLVCCHVTVEYDAHYEKVKQSKMFSGDIENGVVIFGTGEKLHPFDACLINGYAAHALDLDDVHSGVRGHPSAVILSLLFALTNKSQQTERFYEAYVVGLEVMTRFSKILGKSHYEKGFHTTATAGLYGAVSAGVYYLNYSKEAAASAIDLCVSQFSGSRSHFGTVIKPLHAGLTAQKAWQILHFVKQGITGSSNTIVGPNGLLAMYGGSNAAAELLIDWDEQWAINYPGLWFKLHPCCSANAHPIDATKQLLANHEVDILEIASIRLYFPEKGDAALIHTSPKTGEEGRFSAEYCVACLLLGKDLSIETFSVGHIEDNVIELMDKTARIYDKTIPLAKESYPTNRYCIVEITMVNGEVFQARCDIPKGSPGDPLKVEDLIMKARSLLNNRVDSLLSLFLNAKHIQIKDIIA